MQVIVKKKVLEQLVKRLAEERSFHSRRYDQIAGDEKPVMPDAQIAMQLSTDKVPVEDPDFLPVNKKQLSTAASQMAQDVTPREIQKFYKGLKKLLRQTSEPKQYKGMSETDLMEALRPFVINEAFLGQLAGTSTSAADKQKARQERLKKQAYKAAVRGSEGIPDEIDPDELGYTPGETQDTGFRAGPTSDEPEGPPRDESGPTRGRKKKDRETEIIAARDGITSNSRNKALADALEDLRIRWTRAPYEIALRQIKQGAKIGLADTAIGDAHRLLDIFEKAGIPLPKTLEQAQIGVKYEIRVAKPDNFDLQTQVVQIRFVDEAKPPRPELVKALASSPIQYTGGPIEVTEVNPDGTKFDTVYYLLKNFPFNYEEYMDAIKSAIPEARKQLHDEAVAELTRQDRARQKRADQEEDMRAEKEAAEKKGKEISQERIDDAVYQILNIMENDPEEFSEMLTRSGFDQAKFDAMPDKERDAVLQKIAEREIIQTRKQDTQITRTTFGFDANRPESEEEFGVDETSGALESSSSAAKLREELVDAFYQAYMQRVISFTIDDFADDLASAGDKKGNIKIKGETVNIFDMIDKINAAFGSYAQGTAPEDEDFSDIEDFDFDLEMKSLSAEDTFVSPELLYFLDEIRANESLLEDFLQLIAEMSKNIIKSGISDKADSAEAESGDQDESNSSFEKLLPTYCDLVRATRNRKSKALDPYMGALRQIGASDDSRLDEMYVYFKDVQNIARGVVVAAQVSKIMSLSGTMLSDEQLATEFDKQIRQNPAGFYSGYKAYFDEASKNKKKEEKITGPQAMMQLHDKGEIYPIVKNDFKKRYIDIVTDKKSRGQAKSSSQTVEDYSKNFLKIMTEAFEEESDKGPAAVKPPVKKFMLRMFQVAAFDDPDMTPLGFDYAWFSSAISDFIAGKGVKKQTGKKK